MDHGIPVAESHIGNAAIPDGHFHNTGIELITADAAEGNHAQVIAIGKTLKLDLAAAIPDENLALFGGGAAVPDIGAVVHGCDDGADLQIGDISSDKVTRYGFFFQIKLPFALAFCSFP